jgi:hypothetical protein
MRGRIAALLVAALLPVALVASHPATAAGSAFTPPAIKHVWVIELENKSFDAAFVQNTNTYLWKTLPSQGKLLRQYYGTGHFSLDNYISELSGQAPNIDTQADCQTYTDLVGGIASPLDAGGQVIGQGCVYPAVVKTLPNQLTAKGLSWRGYMQDMGLDTTREEATCGRPVSGGQPIDPTGLGGQDTTQSATATDQYAARHNPFLYFHAVIDDEASCKAHVVPLFHTASAGSATDLPTDLKKVATTPAFSFITPNLCDDAHDATCAGKNIDGKNNQGGLYAADRFLRKVVPLIQASPAYQADGMIIVTIDESGDTGTAAGATACCGEPTGPNTPLPGQVGPGGGRIGTVLLSKRFVKPGTVSDVPYNHYSFLRSMEDLFRIGATAAIPGSDNAGHLGYAGQAGLVPFGRDVYDQTVAPPRTKPVAVPVGKPNPGTAGPGLPSTGLPWGVPGAAVLTLLTAAAVRRSRRGRGATSPG